MSDLASNHHSTQLPLGSDSTLLYHDRKGHLLEEPRCALQISERSWVGAHQPIEFSSSCELEPQDL